MRTFLGMILGCLLTIAVVYMHDTMATSTVTSGPAGARNQIVNWDIAASEWGKMTNNIRLAWNKLASTG
jgi:hypothetical protein